VKGLEFLLEGTEVEFVPKKLIMAGYTGRNQEAVRIHVEELKKLGVPAPKEVPTFFVVPVDRLSTEPLIEALELTSSGEPEVVYFITGKDIWVGIGSDHTDREMEKTSIPYSKLVAPKPVSRKLWSYERLKDEWDSLILRSWVGGDGRERVYQEGRLEMLLRPEQLLEILAPKVSGDLEGAVIFGGTVPMLGEELHFEGYFEAELMNPRTNESLSCSYTTKILNYLR